MAVGDTALRGVDEFFNSAGVKLAPLGFGVNTDWEVIERKEITAATTTVELGVDTFDPTLYDEIEITVSELVMTTATQGIRVRVSDDNGATFEAGATDYAYSVSLNRDDSATEIELSSAGTTFLELYDSIGSGAGDSSWWKFQGGRQDSGRNKIYNWTGGRWDGAVFVGGAGGGGVFQGNTNPIDAFQFLAATNQIAEGLFVLRGRRRGGAPTLVSQDDWAVIDDQSGLSAVATHDVFWPDQVYDEIEVSVWGVTVGTDIQDLLLALSTDGTTFLGGAGDYRWLHRTSNMAGSTLAIASSNSDTSIKLVDNLGTAAGEFADVTINIRNVSNTTRLKTLTFEYVAILSDANCYVANGGAQLLDNSNSIQGFRLDGQGATTLSVDRIRVRGRRLTPIGTFKQDWEVIENQVLSGNQAEIEFTDIPSSAFDEFELNMKDVDSDTTGNTIVLQFSTDNGGTWAAGASDYSYAYDQRNAEAVFVEHRSAAAAHIEISQNFGSATDRLLHGSVQFSPLDSGSRKHVRFDITHINDSGSLRGVTGSGAFVGTGSDGIVTAFRLDLSAGGNFTTGSVFTLRGRRKVAA